MLLICYNQSMLFLLASLFFTEPAPLDMPCAEAYLVRERGTLRLEDRYDRLDLWTSQTVVGRWFDEDGRLFVLADLAFEPPAPGRDGAATRSTAADERVPMKRMRANRQIPAAFREAISLLVPNVPIGDEPRHARQLPRGYRNVDYWQHPTNYASIVCAFRQEKSEKWYLASWQLAEGDDYAERMQAFEDQFLRKEFRAFLATLIPQAPQTSQTPQAPQTSQTSQTFSSERELLRADARHSVAAYPCWHFSDSEEFVVLDDLPERDFIKAVTNEFATMRRKYAAALPTEIDGTNVLSVARIYASRGEYLEAMMVEDNTNLMWTAAYWSPRRRELVAYLPEKGEAELMKTLRHEAFHQYLSYATSMIPVSPWLNEGYAQYFESDDVEATVDPRDLPALEPLVVPLLTMDYDEFYSGTDRERMLKYRLALSIVIFLEEGAPRVRFEPFKNLKRDYLAALFETQDMRKATAAAFRNKDLLKLFVSEWVKYWKKQ